MTQLPPTPQTLAKYALSKDQWLTMYSFQDGRCPLCDKIRTLVIDHDHKSGRVRGLLCNLCNGRLGKVKDDAGWMRRAVAYLDDPPAFYLLTSGGVARTLSPRTTRKRQPRRQP